MLYSSKKESEALFIAQNVVLLPSPSQGLSNTVTNRRIDDVVVVKISYFIPPKDHQIAIPLRNLKAELKRLILMLEENGGELINIDLAVTSVLPE